MARKKSKKKLKASQDKWEQTNGNVRLSLEDSTHKTTINTFLDNIVVKTEPLSKKQDLPEALQGVKMKRELLSDNQTFSFTQPFTEVVKTKMSQETDYQSYEVSVKEEKDTKTDILLQSTSQCMGVNANGELKTGHCSTSSPLPPLSLEVFYENDQDEETNQDNFFTSSRSGSQVNLESGRDHNNDCCSKMYLEEKDSQVQTDADESHDYCLEQNILSNEVRDNGHTVSAQEITLHIKNFPDKEEIEMDQNVNGHKRFMLPESFSSSSAQEDVSNGKNASQFSSCDKLPMQPTRSLTIEKLHGSFHPNIRFNNGTKTHQCSLCGKDFFHRSSLSRHKNSHINERPYKCSTCEKAFATKSILQRHMSTHIKSFNCHTCGRSFFMKLELERHIRSHTKEKPFKCSTCEKAFSLKVNLLRHFATHTKEKLYKCNIEKCGKTYADKSGLQNHLKIHAGEKPYKCLTCGMAFIQRAGLRLHIRSHTGEKPYECPSCGKAFSTNSYLRLHIRTHTGEKPYKCPTCEMAFSFGSALKAHIRTHTGQKPFSCSTCGKDFSQRGQLQIHARMHTEEKPYKCPYCEWEFSNNANLQRHLRAHTGERPHKCNFKKCEKVFSQKVDLLYHIQNHFGQKPHKCPTCGKGFCRQAGLRIHLRTHSEVKSYFCPICERGFNQNSNLRNHIKTSHHTIGL